jgi:uncharacterized membrane protein SirB2
VRLIGVEVSVGIQALWMTSSIRIALVAAAICVDFGLGLLLVTRLSGEASEGTYFAVKASIVLTAVWVPFYLWSWRRFRSAFLPVVFFPNPFFALALVLMLACFTGGGCL